MLRLVPRVGLLLAVLAGAVTPVFCAAETAAEELETLRRLAAELGVELDEPTWQLGGDVEAAVGHTDNALLAAINPAASGFARLNVGGIAMRLPRGGVEWFNSVDGTITRYFERDLDNAVFALGRSEVRWRPRDPLRLSAAGQVVHQNEVIDVASLDNVSTLYAGESHLQVQVTSLAFEPTVQWTFASGWTAGAEFSASHDNFRDLDDYDERGTELTLARDVGRRGTLVAAFGVLSRDYETRPQATIGGGPILDTVLGVTQTRFEVRYTMKHGRSGDHLQWRAKARAGLLDNDDNGEGWYDYRRRHVQLDFALEGRAWRLVADTGWRHYLYRVQYAGFGIDPPKRWRTEWSWSARYERDLREGLSAFLEVEWERGQSNDEFLRFRSTTAVLGLRLSH